MVLFLAGACLRAGGLPMEGKLPVGVRVVELTGPDTKGPWVVDALGSRVAYVAHGLRVQELGSGVVHLVAKTTPTQLAWASDGHALAAAFEMAGMSALRLFNAKGDVTAETSVPGRISGLRWRMDGTLLALAVEMEVMRFGTRVTQVLHRWDGKSEPTAKVLNDSTLMPGIATRLGATLPSLLGFELSPLQDEILYYRLNNPPALDFNLRLMLYHLDSGRGRILVTVTPGTGGACFSGHGDRVLYGDGANESHVMDPWGDQTFATYPVLGKRVDQSLSGRILLIDGRLYQNGQLIVTLPADSRAFFPREGRAFYVAQGGHLYGITGLQDESPSSLGEAETARLRELRKWLSEGLISSEDYRQKTEQVRP